MNGRCSQVRRFRISLEPRRLDACYLKEQNNLVVSSSLTNIHREANVDAYYQLQRVYRNEYE